MDTFDITSSSVYFHSRVLPYFKATSKHLLCSFHYFWRTKPLTFIIHVNEAFTIIFFKQFLQEPPSKFASIPKPNNSALLAKLSFQKPRYPWIGIALLEEILLTLPRITVSRGLRNLTRKEHNWLLKSNSCMKKSLLFMCNLENVKTKCIERKVLFCSLTRHKVCHYFKSPWSKAKKIPSSNSECSFQLNSQSLKGNSVCGFSLASCTTNMELLRA